MVPGGEAKMGFCCVPQEHSVLEKVYSVKSQDLIFIIESSYWLQYAEWIEEGKFQWEVSKACWIAQKGDYGMAFKVESIWIRDTQRMNLTALGNWLYMGNQRKGDVKGLQNKTTNEQPPPCVLIITTWSTVEENHTTGQINNKFMTAPHLSSQDYSLILQVLSNYFAPALPTETCSTLLKLLTSPVLYHTHRWPTHLQLHRENIRHLKKAPSTFHSELTLPQVCTLFFLITIVGLYPCSCLEVTASCLLRNF